LFASRFADWAGSDATLTALCDKLGLVRPKL
jgi:hypothetical protein